MLHAPHKRPICQHTNTRTHTLPSVQERNGEVCRHLSDYFSQRRATEGQNGRLPSEAWPVDPRTKWQQYLHAASHLVILNVDEGRLAAAHQSAVSHLFVFISRDMTSWWFWKWEKKKSNELTSRHSFICERASRVGVVPDIVGLRGVFCDLSRKTLSGI